MVPAAESSQFGSLLIAGGLGRGSPVGSIAFWLQELGLVMLGFPGDFELLGQQATAVGRQEGRQTSAQALSRPLPGVKLK